MVETAFDLVLVAVLAALAWRSLSVARLFQAAVLFIAFGLTMVLAWARLSAPDLALAEAAVGAGLTGALLVHVARLLDRRDDAADDDESAQ